MVPRSTVSAALAKTRELKRTVEQRLAADARATNQQTAADRVVVPKVKKHKRKKATHQEAPQPAAALHAQQGDESQVTAFIQCPASSAMLKVHRGPMSCTSQSAKDVAVLTLNTLHSKWQSKLLSHICMQEWASLTVAGKLAASMSIDVVVVSDTSETILITPESCIWAGAARAGG